MTIFAQITDLHIDNIDPSVKVDTRVKALAVLDAVYKQKIEQLLITGDIAESSDGLDWFLNQVEMRGFKYKMILGNHDETELYLRKNVFHGAKTYFATQLDGFSVLFMDSGRDRVDPEQLAWLEEQITHTQQDIILFIHHPVLDCGDSLMDRRFPLINRDEVLKTLLKTSQKIALFCGHYHREQIVEYGNIIQYVTPSTYYQIRKYSSSIEVESEMVGYRILSLENGKYETQVKYVEAGNPGVTG